MQFLLRPRTQFRSSPLWTCITPLCRRPLSFSRGRPWRRPQKSLLAYFVVRLSKRPLPLRDWLRRWLNGSKSPSHLTFSSTRNSLSNRLQGSFLAVGQPRRLLLPVPRLLPFLPIVEGGRSFEGSLPSLQPQVGGVFVLARHWSVWQSYGNKGLAAEVLRHGYQVPFHHLPLVSREPREFPSCAPGSVWALALKEKVSKMLQKVTLKCVN